MEFIALLEEQQELIRIHAPVSPILEITEVADRV
ncbi:MAG TPA: UbiD family decarboxylase, partial [Bacteroidales bacterium]|nr:UbiD family decarboxylase [Bacteroidales bacterium]